MDIMKILVTGGSGFIGSNLCEKLLSEGHEVFCLDNFYSSSEKNIARLRDYAEFHLIEHDVTFPLTLKDKIDQIYNLACPASPVWYAKDPIKTIRTNVEGTINILEFADRCHARVLQASTSEVYGDPLEHPQTESYRGNVNPIGPRACYDEGKRSAETIFMDYHRQRNIDVRIARIFNTYGPWMAQNDGRVVSNFIIQALKNKPITIYGDGTQTRSFQYITDLTDGLTRLMRSETTIGPVNIGNPGEFTMKELAEKVVRAIPSKSVMVYRPLPQDDPVRRRPDITLAKKALGWSPKTSLDEGLSKTIEYFRQTL